MITPTNSFRITRLIAAGMAGGVAALWLIAWVRTDGGTDGLSPNALSPELALMAWAAVALPGFAAALLFRNRAARPDSARADTGGFDGGRADARPDSARVDAPPRPMEHDPRAPAAEHAQVQTSLVIAHALLEGPALLGGVLFLLLGSSPVVWVAPPVYALGLLIVWPRAEWFGDGGASAGR